MAIGYTIAMEPVSNQELREIVLENQKMLVEINERLSQQEAKQKRNFYLKIVWFFVLFILPTILIYWYLGPVYESYLSPATAGDNQDQIQQINNLLQGL